jgi:SHS2 domain-containing protein
MAEDPKADAPWVFVDHTADIRIEARGKTIKELFVNAAAGLTALVSTESGGIPEIEMEIALDGNDYEQLLVDWLRELLFLNRARGFVLVRADVTQLAETGLVARLEGRTAGPDEDGPDGEIKAVTYHGLSIRKEGEGYSARILFDV